jgi:hypothetical protein
MARRTRLLLFGLPAALVGALLVAWLLWPRTAITRENAARIELGMTVAEVEAFLGGPARDDVIPRGLMPDLSDDAAENDGRYALIARGLSQRGMNADNPRCAIWRSGQAVVLVLFNDGGRAVDREVIPVRRKWESPFNVLSRWLGL